MTSAGVLLAVSVCFTLLVVSGSPTTRTGNVAGREFEVDAVEDAVASEQYDGIFESPADAPKNPDAVVTLNRPHAKVKTTAAYAHAVQRKERKPPSKVQWAGAIPEQGWCNSYRMNTEGFRDLESEKYDEPLPQCKLYRKVLCTPNSTLGHTLLAYKGRALVLYHVHNKAGKNVDFFMKQGLIDGKRSTELFDRVDFVFYSVDPEAVTAVTESRARHDNIRFLSIPPVPCESCGVHLVLDFLGFDASRAGNNQYRSLIWLNSHMRGPFLNKRSSPWVDVVSMGAPETRRGYYFDSDQFWFKSVSVGIFSMTPGVHAQSSLMVIPKSLLQQYRMILSLGCQTRKSLVPPAPQAASEISRRTNTDEAKSKCLGYTDLISMNAFLRTSWKDWLVRFYSFGHDHTLGRGLMGVKKRVKTILHPPEKKPHLRERVYNKNPSLYGVDPCQAIFARYADDVPSPNLKQMDRLTLSLMSDRESNAAELDAALAKEDTGPNVDPTMHKRDVFHGPWDHEFLEEREEELLGLIRQAKKEREEAIQSWIKETVNVKWASSDPIEKELQMAEDTVTWKTQKFPGGADINELVLEEAEYYRKVAERRQARQK